MFKPISVLHNSQSNRIPTMLRNLTITKARLIVEAAKEVSQPDS